VSRHESGQCPIVMDRISQKRNIPRRHVTTYD
jgi:hypothetical protein